MGRPLCCPNASGEQADPVGSGWLVAARASAIAATRVGKPARRDLVSLVDRSGDLLVGAAVDGEQARALELQRERRERVGEHVVHLAREPCALGRGCRSSCLAGA